MDEREFERDLQAFLDGELPPSRAAEMEAAVAASPQLTERVAAERAFDARVRRSLAADANSVETVRRLLERARPEPVAAPAGRMFRLPHGALRVAAGFLVVAVTAMWWFCIPPFECSYMQALEAASHDPAAVPCPIADAFAKKCGLPERIDGMVAAPPAASTTIAFWGWEVKGVRLDYVCGDGSALHAVICDSPNVRPSSRRSVERDGEQWWICDVNGCRVVAFPGKAGAEVCAVTGPAGDESVYEVAKLLRGKLE